MKPTIKFITLTSLILIISSLVFSNLFNHYFLDRNPDIDERYKRAIEDQNPELIFMGNSILKKAVDFELLDLLLESKVLDLSVNATTAPDWYLFLKNNISTSSKRPLTVVIFFKNYRLTDIPSLTGEEDQKRINKFAGADEQVFDSLVNNLSNIERFTLEVFAPYAYQVEIRNIVERPFQYGFPGLLSGWQNDQTDLAVETTFANDNLVPELLELSRQESETFGDGDQLNRFDASVNSSFLPHIIALAVENDIELVFARIPTLQSLEQGDSLEIAEYFRQLKNYLDENNLVFIDFGELAQELNAEHYRDNDHLNDLGRPLFTPIVAEVMKLLGYP
jgi:hypothetical protein